VDIGNMVPFRNRIAPPPPFPYGFAEKTEARASAEKPA
jgi:hypothetical protein